MPGVIVALIILIIVALLIAVSCVKIVPQATACVVERLGGYLATWSVGIHFKAPFIDRVAKRVVLKEQVVDFPPQPVITKDNVTMQIDTVVYFQITDPKLYAYGVENPIMAIENLTATTLRNIIGDLELDETLTSRETINTKMRSSLDVATDPWGIKVNRVELKNIIPPAAIQDAMEKQMKAERERREAILRAEGEKKSTVLVAEGKKESAILDAEAEKQAAILRAEGKERGNDPRGRRSGRSYFKDPAGKCRRTSHDQRSCTGSECDPVKELRGICKSSRRKSNQDHYSVRDPGNRRSCKICYGDCSRS